MDFRADKGVGRRLGHGRWVELAPVDRRVEDEVGIGFARRLGDRAHEIVVGEVKAAAEDGRQKVHSGVTVPRMARAGRGPNVRESKLLA